MLSEKIRAEIENIKRIREEEDIYPFPYEDVRAFKKYFYVEFKKRALIDSCLEGDFNTYFLFIAGGLALGGITRYLHNERSIKIVRNGSISHSFNGSQYTDL